MSALRSPARPRVWAGPPRRRRHRWPLVAAFVLLALAGAAVYGALLARDVWQAASAGRAAFNRGAAALGGPGVAALTPRRLALAEGSFAAAEGSFAAARARLGPWAGLAGDYGARLPGPAGEVAAVAPLLALGADVSRLSATLAQGLQPVAGALQAPAAGSAGDLLARLMAALQAAQPALARAQAQLAAAQADRWRLAALPAVPQAASMLAAYDRQVPQLSALVADLRHLPAVLGADGPRSYLLVYQDETDLRATGGFIGSASLLVLDHGHLAQTDYETTGSGLGGALQLSDRQTGAPPQPLFYYRGLGSFQLRDANFWPDFPTSAHHIADLYRRATGRRVDGVVALTPTVASYLLRALGPLKVPGFPDTVTADNVISRAEYYVHGRIHAGSPYALILHRNQFVVALNHAVLGALLSAGSQRLAAVAPQLAAALVNRDIQISLADPSSYFAGVLARAHWDGALRTDPGDYLGIFDQNVTDSKLNGYIDEAITYDAVRRPDGRLQCRVTVNYRNRAQHTDFWTPRLDYSDYLRVAVPAGVTVGALDGYADTFWPDEMERGRHLIAGGLVVPAGGTQSVSASYTLPASLFGRRGSYTLVVQKQPGAPPPRLTVRLSAGGHRWTAQLVLARDTTFSTPWAAPSGPLTVQVAAPASLGGQIPGVAE